MIQKYSGILLSHEKWNNAICNNTDGPRVYHTRLSKSDRERQISYHLYVETKKNDTNVSVYKTETDSQT